MRLRSFAVLTALLLSAGAPALSAEADTLLTLTNANQNIDGSGTLIYDATVTNTGNSTVYFNADNYTDTSQLASTSRRWTTVRSGTPSPLSLDAGQSYTGELFAINVSVGAPQGVYNGTFYLLGGGNDNTYNDPASVSFSAKSRRSLMLL